jgi:hypothetical protein
MLTCNDDYEADRPIALAPGDVLFQILNVPGFSWHMDEDGYDVHITVLPRPRLLVAEPLLPALVLGPDLQ